MMNDFAASALECFYKWEKKTPEKIFLIQPTSLKWREYTWAEFSGQVRRVASFINSLNLYPGSSICIYSANSVDWFVVDIAIMLTGHVSVPLYPSQDLESANYVLDHSECRLMFVGRGADQVKGITSEISKVAMLGCVVDCEYNLNDIIDKYPPFLESPIPDPESVFTILYTSGTTGMPKGVMHMHGTPTKVVPDIIRVQGLGTRSEKFFSYLPLAHSAERILIEMVGLYLNAKVYFSEGLETFSDELRYVRPTYFFSVPRLWDKFKESIDAIYSREAQLEFKENEKSRVRELLGLDNAKFLLTGSAPVKRDVQEWFVEMGMRLCEGYGMTETFLAGSCWSMPEAPIAGCVGLPSGGCERKISNDGEILFRSGSVMKGYYKDAEKTAEVLVDGWYRTGDCGFLDDNDYLWVTGRIGEMFKTAKGEFIKPARIENLFGGLSILEQALVFGHGSDQPLMLVSLSELGKKTPSVQLSTELNDALIFANSQLTPHERVSQIFVTPVGWSIDNGLLTPTMKMKRKAIESYFQEFVSAGIGKGVVVF